jgi:hypothetical protein
MLPLNGAHSIPLNNPEVVAAELLRFVARAAKT